jgi:hypothetical protein
LSQEIGPVSDILDSDATGEIRLRTQRALIDVATGGPEALTRRLAELDREWTLERVVEVAASAVSLLFLALGAFLSPWFLLVPAIVSLMLLQHAVMGWSPPVRLLRRVGLRRLREVDEERFALKALRGDFEAVAAPTTLRGDRGVNALNAARS